MKNDKNEQKILIVLGLIFVVWFGLLIAPYLEHGLLNVLKNLNKITQNPFSFSFGSYSLRGVFICLVFYMIGVGIYMSTRKNKRPQEEYGSAKWADPKAVNKIFANKDPYYNKLFTQNVRMGLDVRRYQKNLNTIVIGGSGAGKTRYYAKPNLMQCNSSFVVLDPKGEILRDTGHLLEKEGYVIRVIDLIDMTRSHCYNPFHYLQGDNDILKLITNLIRNTTPKGSQTNDPFWEKSETALLQALMLYLFHEAPEEEQNREVCIDEKKLRAILTKRQFERLTLYAIRGMTVEQIAEQEGVAHQNVSKSIRQAKKKIKFFFEKQGAKVSF